METKSVSRDLQLVRGRLKPFNDHYTVPEKIELLHKVWDHPLYPLYKEKRSGGDLDSARQVIEDEEEYLKPFFAYCYFYDERIFDRLKRYVEK